MKEIADLFSIRIDAVIVLIVVTIGTIIKTFNATVFLHFSLQNKETYFYISGYFEEKSAKKLLH